jgi:hypothetical protein
MGVRCFDPTLGWSPTTSAEILICSGGIIYCAVKLVHEG